MTIEYGYSEPKPLYALVRGPSSRAYRLTLDHRFDYIAVPAPHNVDVTDVPEVCEAMMKLAGKDVEHACVADVGKRIIARLTLMRGNASARSYDSRAMGYEVAEQIVREECGL